MEGGESGPAWMNGSLDKNMALDKNLQPIRILLRSEFRLRSFKIVYFFSYSSFLRIVQIFECIVVEDESKKNYNYCILIENFSLLI